MFDRRKWVAVLIPRFWHQNGSVLVRMYVEINGRARKMFLFFSNFIHKINETKITKISQQNRCLFSSKNESLIFAILNRLKMYLELYSEWFYVWCEAVAGCAVSANPSENPTRACTSCRLCVDYFCMLYVCCCCVFCVCEYSADFECECELKHGDKRWYAIYMDQT